MDREEVELVRELLRAAAPKAVRALALVPRLELARVDELLRRGVEPRLVLQLLPRANVARQESRGRNSDVMS